MAHITINQYLQQVRCCTFWFRAELLLILLLFLSQVSEAIDNHEGSFCAELLSFKHPHVANPRLQASCRPHSCCEEYCAAQMWSDWCLCVPAGQPRRKMSAAFRAAVWWDGGSSPQVGKPSSRSDLTANLQESGFRFLNIIRARWKVKHL